MNEGSIRASSAIQGLCTHCRANLGQEGQVNRIVDGQSSDTSRDSGPIDDSKMLLRGKSDGLDVVGR